MKISTNNSAYLPILIAGCLIAGNRASAQTAISGADYNPATGNRYVLLSQSNWPNAQTAANGIGGHLVTVNGPDENTWIANQYGNSRYYWIGLNDIASEGNFVWASTGTSFPSYRNWNVGEPNNTSHPGGDEDAVFLNTDSNAYLTWNDFPHLWDNAGGKPIHGVVEINRDRAWRAAGNGNFNATDKWKTSVGNTPYAPTQYENVTFGVAGTSVVNFTAPAAARTLNVSAGDVTFSMAGNVFNVGGTINIGSTILTVGGGSMVNTGRYSVASNGTLDVTSGILQLGGGYGSYSAVYGELYFRDGAIFENHDTTGVEAAGGRFGLRGGELAMTNYAGAFSSLLSSVDSSTLIEGYGTVSARVDLLDAAIIQSDGGTLNLTNAVGGGGTVKSLAGSTLNINGGNGNFSAVTNLDAAGLINLGANFSAANTTITSGGTVNLDGQTLNSATSIASGGTLTGTGTITGNVTNAGTLAPGNSPGTLTITGDVVSTGEVEFELFGTAPGNFDRLIVSGTFTNNGTIKITLDALAYTPVNGDEWDVLDAAGGALGDFSPGVFDLAALDAGLTWDLSDFAAEGILRVIPEPSGAVALSLVGVALARRRMGRAARA